VERKGDVLVEVREDGYEVGYRKSHRTLSSLGIADLIGGWLLLLPFLGLLAPAAWEHDPGAFGITLDPKTDPTPRSTESPKL